MSRYDAYGDPVKLSQAEMNDLRESVGMKPRIPYAGKDTRLLRSEYGGHAGSKNTVEINFRIRQEALAALNARFLADSSSTTFAEYMRKFIDKGLAEP